MSETHTTIRDTAIEASFAIFSERPNSSLIDMATRASAGRATWHNQFRDSIDLMHDLALAALKDLDDAADSAAAENRVLTAWTLMQAEQASSKKPQIFHGGP